MLQVSRRTLKFVFLALACLSIVGIDLSPAAAREIDYDGGEAKVYVTPGEPTVVSFPHEVDAGYRVKSSAIVVERRGRDLILFAQPELRLEGEVLVIYTKDNRSYILRILPAASSE